MSKVIAVHQPNYLPWIGYFYKMFHSDVFVLFDSTQYSKKSWINRNRIKTPKGPSWLSVPVMISKGHKQRINEIEVCNQFNWRNKHLKTIQNFYSSTPFFKYYKDEIENIYGQRYDKLITINLKIVNMIRKWLNIDNDLVLSSELNLHDEDNNNLGICKNLAGDVYLSGDGSDGYLNEGDFTENDINITYTSFTSPSYRQLFGENVDNISIIDMLFNNGADEITSYFKNNPIDFKNRKKRINDDSTRELCNN